MPASKIVITYSKNQNAVRCMYVPDHNSEIPDIIAHEKATHGEYLGVLVVIREEYPGMTPQAILAKALGREAKSTKHFVVKDGTIVGCTHCDPLIDKAPHGHSLVHEDHIGST